MKLVKNKKLFLTFVTVLVLMLMMLLIPSLSASAEDNSVEVESITLSKTSSSLYTGQTETLTATVAPTNATNKNVVWTSSNPSVATVNQSGVVTGVSFGSATITATAADGSGVYASCEYMVNPYMENLYYPSKNQDARRVQFEFRTGSDISMVEMHVGNRVYYINRPSSTTQPFDEVINGDRVKVSISYDYNTQKTIWNVQLRLATHTIPPVPETIYFKMWNGYYMAETLRTTGFVFWRASIKTSLYSDLNLYNMFFGMNSPPFTYSLVDCLNFQPLEITNDLITYPATGMVVLKKYGDNIYEMFYLLKYGDVTGDGIVNIDDYTAAENFVNGSAGLSSYIYILAGDLDMSGMIRTRDLELYLQYFDYGVDIPQDIPREITDALYYLRPVTFS